MRVKLIVEVISVLSSAVWDSSKKLTLCESSVAHGSGEQWLCGTWGRSVSWYFRGSFCRGVSVGIRGTGVAVRHGTFPSVCIFLFNVIATVAKGTHVDSAFPPWRNETSNWFDEFGDCGLIGDKENTAFSTFQICKIEDRNFRQTRQFAE